MNLNGMGVEGGRERMGVEGKQDIRSRVIGNGKEYGV